MPEFLKKALARGLTPGNVASWCTLEAMRRFGVLVGTLRLRAKAKLFGVKLGAGCTAHGPVGLMRWPGSAIVIGRGCSFISSWRRATAAAIGHPVRLRTFAPGARIEIGDGCQFTGASITCRSTAIAFGRNVLVGPGAVVTDSDFHKAWPVETRAVAPGMEADRPVSIGDGAWIGMHAIVLKGVAIGEGAVIGAGSVVTRDVPAFAVACGSPARVVSRRDAQGRRLDREGRQEADAHEPHACPHA